MAEMNVPEGGGKKKGHKKQRSKKMSTRVDLTAMVDLAFLLLTFFMLTTTFNKPVAMQVNMPAKPDPNDPKPPELKQSKVLTLILGPNDRVYWYTGIDDITADSTDFSKEGVRERILTRQKEVAAEHGSKDSMVCLIKPMPNSRYKNMVDILDEMDITETKRYAIVELNRLDSMVVFGKK
jgi:biopolymer transport protein ExbD